MEWFYYALAGAIFFTIYSLVIKKLLKNEGDVKIFNVLMQMTVGILLLVISIFTQTFVKVHPIHIGLMVIASFMFAAASTLLTISRQREEVSKVSVVRQTSLLWIFLGGIFIFNETITIPKIAGICCIIIGSALAMWQKDSFKPSRELGYVLLATLATAINTLISKFIVDDNLSPSLYIGTVISLSAVWLMVFLHHPIARIRKEISFHKAKFILPAILTAGSMFSLMNGYKVGEVSQVYPVYSISLILTVLASIIFLGERDNLTQKIMGAIVVFGGILLIRLL